MQIGGIVNLQDEYGGCVKEYTKFGIEQLHVPVVDHYEPDVAQIQQCIEFIETKRAVREPSFQG